jgi:hypothetical protein
MLAPANLHQLKRKRSSPSPENTMNRSWIWLAPLTSQDVVVHDVAPDTSQLPSRGPVWLSRWRSMVAFPLTAEIRASKEVTPSRKSTFFTLM